jgi:transcriptional regulator with XRE-family HTH domain
VLTGSQIRAARGLLNLSVAELAEQTHLAINTIRKAESCNGYPSISPANIKLLEAVFESFGVVFIPADELGPGVRLREIDPAAPKVRRRQKK